MVPNTREPNTRWSQIELESEIRIQLSRKIKMLNSLLNYPFIFYQKKVYRSRTAAKCFIRQPTINGAVNHPRAGMRLFKKDFHTIFNGRKALILVQNCLYFHCIIGYRQAEKKIRDFTPISRKIEIFFPCHKRNLHLVSGLLEEWIEYLLICVSIFKLVVRAKILLFRFF